MTLEQSPLTNFEINDEMGQTPTSGKSMKNFMSLNYKKRPKLKKSQTII